MKTLIWDIETAPAIAYIWRLWDTHVPLERLVEDPYTLCFAAKWMDERDVQFYARWKGGHRRMLQAAHRLLDEADAVVSYNGKRFDSPVLTWEFMHAHMSPPSPYKHIDLYRTMKTASPLSRKLDFVSQRLGLGAKTKHKGMDLWREVMGGDPSARVMMEKYNRQDVTLTDKLYRELLPWIPHHPNVAIELGYACPKCGSDKLQARGWNESLTRRYRRFRCMSCGAWSQATHAEPGSAKVKAA